jgi:hypothetical protein
MICYPETRNPKPETRNTEPQDLTPKSRASRGQGFRPAWCVILLEHVWSPLPPPPPPPSPLGTEAGPDCVAPAQAVRYVRLSIRKRATSWGVSVWRFQVYGLVRGLRVLGSWGLRVLGFRDDLWFRMGVAVGLLSSQHLAAPSNIHESRNPIPPPAFPPKP